MTRRKSFALEAREWLAANIPASANRLPPMASGRDALTVMMSWQRRICEGGWAGITVPEHYGGRGGQLWQQNIWNEETARLGCSPGMLAVALNMVVPTLLTWGTPELCQRHIPAILRGDSLWCQLFSEPSAGSDLAALRTTAVRDGGEWVVNGQKIWTSEAHHADHAILLARTAPDQPKHKGLSYFLVDMSTSALDIRPILDISKERHFNEVFITDLRLPASSVVGPLHEGWKVANSTLAAERAVMGGGLWGIGFKDLLDLAERANKRADPLVRQRLARIHQNAMVLEFLRLRSRSAANMNTHSSASAVLKLATGIYLGELANLAVDLLGCHALATGTDNTDTDWARLLVRSFSVKFAGGTPEIQRNVLAERVLGLPREPKLAD